MDTPVRQKMLARLKRISGQVAGVQRMIDEERYCLDVLSQISAIRSALDALGVELLNHHIECCVMGHGAAQPHLQSKTLNADELLAELRAALTRFLK